MNQEHLVASLQRSSLLGSLSVAELQHLAASAITVQYAARQRIFDQGENGDRCFVVLSGAVRVHTTRPDGGEVVLSILGAGSCFGELALLDGGPRSASVDAIARCELAVIDRPTLLGLLRTHPDLAASLLIALSQRIRRLTDRVEQLALMEVPARLANLLVGLASEVGTDFQGKQYLSLRLAQSDLAAMIGTSRESVNKQINLWKTQEIVAVVDGKLQILQPALLQGISQGE